MSTPTDHQPIQAYHLISQDCRLGYGDGRVVKVGEAVEVAVKPRLCQAGLHASRKPFDTLQYAPSNRPRLCRVEVSGDVVEGDDKLCGRRRVVTAMLTAEETARLFQEFALKAADLALDEAAECRGGGARAEAAIQKSRDAVETARRYLAGRCTAAEMVAAQDAAEAARDVARIAERAATAVTWDGAGAAADAAGAAWYGAVAARYGAVAARNAAEAAGYAAGAARYAAWAARYAAWAGVPRSRLDGVMEGLVREAFDKQSEAA